MNGWVFIFSKFTSEALLLEAFFICALLCTYTAMYVLRIRKYGVAGTQVPSNVVKAYLAQLVSDAEDLRNQLFGLLGKGTHERINFGKVSTHTIAMGSPSNSPTQSGNHATPPVPASGGSDQQGRLQELEKKMSEQALALEQILNDKMKLEEELANAKKNLPQSASGANTSGEDTGPLKARIEALEAQLAEYAIIEDEISSLKKLQKENKVLRAQLEQLGQGAAPTAPAAPAAQATPAESAIPAAGAATAPTPSDAPAPTPSDASAAQAFENIVSEVEQSLGAADAAPTVEKSPDTAEAPATDPAPADAAAAAPLTGKPSESLEAAFEKMIQP